LRFTRRLEKSYFFEANQIVSDFNKAQNLFDIGKEFGILAAYAAGLLILASFTLRHGIAS
jgi:hypothetical protein